MVDEEKTDLEMAQELSEIELEASDEEFLDEVQATLDAKKKLKSKDSKRLKEVWEKYCHDPHA